MYSRQDAGIEEYLHPSKCIGFAYIVWTFKRLHAWIPSFDRIILDMIKISWAWKFVNTDTLLKDED